MRRKRGDHGFLPQEWMSDGDVEDVEDDGKFVVRVFGGWKYHTRSL